MTPATKRFIEWFIKWSAEPTPGLHASYTDLLGRVQVFKDALLAEPDYHFKSTEDFESLIEQRATYLDPLNNLGLRSAAIAMKMFDEAGEKMREKLYAERHRPRPDDHIGTPVFRELPTFDRTSTQPAVEDKLGLAGAIAYDKAERQANNETDSEAAVRLTKMMDDRKRSASPAIQNLQRAAEHVATRRGMTEAIDRSLGYSEAPVNIVPPRPDLSSLADAMEKLDTKLRKVEAKIGGTTRVPISEFGSATPADAQQHPTMRSILDGMERLQRRDLKDHHEKMRRHQEEQAKAFEGIYDPTYDSNPSGHIPLMTDMKPEEFERLTQKRTDFIMDLDRRLLATETRLDHIDKLLEPKLR